MSDEMISLGHRAMACKWWRWLPGMMVYGTNPETDDFSYTRLRELDRGKTVREQVEEFVDPYPFLNDAPTIGCLMRLVREAWDDEWLTTLGFYNSSGGQWFVHGGKLHGSRFRVRVTFKGYLSEAEALIAALENAP